MFTVTDESQDENLNAEKSCDRGTPVLKIQEGSLEKQNPSLIVNNFSPNRTTKIPSKYIKESPSMREITCLKHNTFNQGNIEGRNYFKNDESHNSSNVGPHALPP